MYLRWNNSYVSGEIVPEYGEDCFKKVKYLNEESQALLILCMSDRDRISPYNINTISSS